MRDQEQSEPKGHPHAQRVAPLRAPDELRIAASATRQQCHYILFLDAHATHINGSHFLTLKKTVATGIHVLYWTERKNNVKRGSRSPRRDQLYSSLVEGACGDFGEEYVRIFMRPGAREVDRK